MAVAAIDSVIAHMMFVAELHRLFARDVLPRQVRRTCSGQQRQNCKPDQEKCRKDTKSGDEVRASMENLGHVRFCTLAGSALKGPLH